MRVSGGDGRRNRRASSNCATRPSSTFASTVPPEFLRAGVVSNGSADEQRAVRDCSHSRDGASSYPIVKTIVAQEGFGSSIERRRLLEHGGALGSRFVHLAEA